MAHKCHWPGCPKEVPPSMWGCKPHWFKLPKPMRDRIWATYRPGQEITKTPSTAYLEAAQEVRLWCLQHDLNEIAPTLLEERDGRFYATEDGCRKLEAWFAERGVLMNVESREGRFDVQFREDHHG